ncbi:DNA cytosine methyltransferase [Streptococcus infantarius]|uniref:DNA cytosine methyltransferase n=1 Tax=Streptococcus infantarius TaxID=102684 RepID=UPI0022E92A37|nr:DNA cytosine methyltransferase [Streptococcus infantarius]
MKFLDLFAGIGGFRLGLESAGHECVGFCEIDKFARASYKAIHNTEGEIELHDITQVSDEEWRKFRGTVDIICGGFPCQAFSIAGKRKGFLDETRGTLFFEIARAAKEIKPPLLFLENVKGLLSHDKGKTFRTILSTLDELGYDAEWQLLNSKDFGVPQNRERVFIIGHLRGTGGREVFPIGGENAEIPIQIIGNADPRRKIGSRTDVYDKTGLIGTLLSSDYKEPKLIQVGSLEGKFQSANRIYSPTGLAPTLKTMQGGGLEPKIAIRQGTKKGYALAGVGDYINLDFPTSKTRRGRVGRQVANTLLTSGNQGIVTEDLKIRKLTPRECWRLQAFPDWAFDKAQEVNSNSQLYKQAGNSVTVNVIKAIAERLEE